MPVLSLVYDDNLVRVASRRRGQYVVGKADLPTGAVTDGVIADAAAFRQALGQAMHKAGLDHKHTWRVIAAPPESRVITKLIEMPKVPVKELPEAIRWQARQYLPIDPLLLALDYQLLTSRTKTQYLVLVIATPREVIDSLWLALEKNLTLTTVLPRSAALAQLTYDRPHTPNLLVDVEDDSSLSLVITKNRTARFSSSVAFGRKNDLIRKSIEQVIKFYEERDGQKRQVNKILVLPGPQTDRLMKLLAQAEIRPVEPLHVGARPKERVRLDEYLVNVGLLQVRTRLNLLLPDYRAILSTKKLEEWLIAGWYMQWVAAIFLLVLAGLSFMNRRTLAEAAATATIIAQEQPIDSQRLQQYHKVVGALAHAATLQNRRSELSTTLTQLNELKPSGIDFITIRYSGEEGTLEITGQRADRAVLEQFMEGVRNEFASASLPTQDWASPDAAPFHLTIEGQ